MIRAQINSKSVIIITNTKVLIMALLQKDIQVTGY